MFGEMFTLLFNASLETLSMIVFSGFFAVFIGLPLGIILYVSQPQGLLPAPYLYQSLAFYVNITRSIPFVILLIAIIPLTRLLVGTSIGTLAAIVPLSFAAIPFFARISENALNELPKGLIEAGITMGATPSQIICKISLREARPSLIAGLTLTLINLVAYSAMAGVVGGGGLGDLAIRYGYQRFDTEMMLWTIMILIILVQFLQWLGNYYVKKIQHYK